MSITGSLERGRIPMPSPSSRVLSGLLVLGALVACSSKQTSTPPTDGAPELAARADAPEPDTTRAVSDSLPANADVPEPTSDVPAPRAARTRAT